MYKKLIYLISFVLVLGMVQPGIVKADLDDDPNLVGWWKLDSNDSNTAVDSSGNNYHGTINNGPVLETGSPYDNSGYFVFDGTDDWVDVNHLEFLLPKYTVSMYFRLDGGVTDERWLFAAVNGNDDHGIGLSLNRNNPGRLRYIHRYPFGPDGVGNEDTYSPETGPFYNDGEWHHLAAVRESDANRVLYADGQVVGTNTNALGAFDEPARLLFGTVRLGWIARMWRGGMDDVRIYNRALSQAEIEELARGVSLLARSPNPEHEETDVQNQPTLSWTPGIKAASHKVYFDPDEDKVTDRSDCEVNGVSTTEPNYPIPDSLELGETYYWAIDEVNGATVWSGSVWHFTVGHYFIADSFERYPDGNSVRLVWKGGLGGSYVNTSADIGGPVRETQALAIDYNNTVLPYYSEAYADTTGPNSLECNDSDWLSKGVKALSLWLHGRPDLRGSWSEDSGTHTITGDGWIWGTADGFHYAYKNLALTGPASIKAKVESLVETNSWAKAGVMIRSTLDPGSKYAMLAITPHNGTTLQWRAETDGDTDDVYDANFTTFPHWVKLTFDNFGDVIGFKAENSSDGSTWTQVGDIINLSPLPENIYIGLCVSGNTGLRVSTGEFSNVSTTGAVSGNWQSQDIGITENFNNPEPMYVVLEDSDSNAIVYYDDPNATQTGEWTQWMILLDEFSGQGVDLSDVKKMYIGIGERGSSPGGFGVMYFDDIRLYEPYCVLSERSDDFVKVDYIPVGLPAGDCTVDNQELEIMARDWLVTEDTIIPTTNPDTNGLVAYYSLNEGSGTTTLDNSGNGHNGTFSTSGITWVIPGLLGYSAINADGAPGGRISIGTFDPVGPEGEFTLSLWVRCVGTGNVAQGLIGKRDGWGSNDVIQFTFAIWANNQLNLTSYTDGAYSQGGVTTPYLGRWVHVAATYNDDEPNNVTFYRNGQDVGEGSVTLGTATTATVTIGNTMSATAWDNSPETFNGDIDEVRIYNRALSVAEIAYLADLTPGDGEYHVPVPSPADLYGLEAEPARAIDLRDFAVLANTWLEEQLWP